AALVPSDLRYLPLDCAPVRELIAACCVAAAVPPCASGSGADRCVPTTCGLAFVPPRSPAICTPPAGAAHVPSARRKSAVPPGGVAMLVGPSAKPPVNVLVPVHVLARASTPNGETVGSVVTGAIAARSTVAPSVCGSEIRY